MSSPDVPLPPPSTAVHTPRTPQQPKRKLQKFLSQVAPEPVAGRGEVFVRPTSAYASQRAGAAAASEAPPPVVARNKILLDYRPKLDLRRSVLRCSPMFPPLHATLIDANLLIGSREAASSMALLRYYGVTHILNVSAQVPNFFPDDFLYCHIPLVDTEAESLRPHFRRAFEFLNDCVRIHSRVLVHCVAGVSRSVTFAVAYIMYRRQTRLRDALNDVIRKRFIACPNNGFLLELADLEVALLGCSSVAACTDKLWNFPEWNKRRKKLPLAPERPKACVIM